MDSYNVLALLNERTLIVSVNSSAFVFGEEWIQIDEGVGDRYHHAQGNYFKKPIYDDRGIPRYAYVPDGDPKWRERTKEEMDADYVPPMVKPSAEELLDALMEGIDDA